MPREAALMQGFQEIRDYFTSHLMERRKNPGDDLISYLTLQTYPDGRQFTDNHVLGSVQLLLVTATHVLGSVRLLSAAGTDTTWSGIGSCLWHLAKTPDDRRRLVQDPGLMP